MILTITGPSGVGKTTLLHNLLKAYPEAYALESVTTRAPRPTDEGSYVYVNEEKFKKMEEQGEFLWTVSPHGKRYGMRKEPLDKALAEGLAVSILVIEAVEKLHAYAQKGAVRSFYVEIDNEEDLRKRFQSRGDMTVEQVEARILECRSWNERAKSSSVPFEYLNGATTREGLFQEASELIKK